MEGEQAVVVVAPLGRDSFVIEQTLAGVTCISAQTIAEANEYLRRGAGMLLLTEESLSADAVEGLLAMLAEQPPWSDLPIVLLAGTDMTHSSAVQVASIMATRNLTVLQRPLSAVTLVTAVQTALRARRRQYQVRDLLDRERSAREQAETAIHIKDEFLATISHELRTPLGAILLWASLFDSGKLNAEQQVAAMRAIKTSAVAQSQLVEDLLDVSRILMGNLRVDMASHALGPIIEAAVEVAQPMAEAKGVRLDVALDARDEHVLVDVGRTQQVFWNLLTNAIKFTPNDGVVSVRLTRQLDELVATVSDTGQGIATSLVPHVFERFRQADPGAGARGGLGLGLPIVKQLIELHGGTVEVFSAGSGLGATFTVRLPVPAASSGAPSGSETQTADGPLR